MRPMLRMKHICFCFPCSVRMRFSICCTPLRYKRWKQKWPFHCGGVAKLKNVLPMLRKKHTFLCFPCSVRMTFLKLTWPLRYKWHFLRGGESCCSCGANHLFSLWCPFFDVFNNCHSGCGHRHILRLPIHAGQRESPKSSIYINKLPINRLCRQIFVLWR